MMYRPLVARSTPSSVAVALEILHLGDALLSDDACSESPIGGVIQYRAAPRDLPSSSIAAGSVKISVKISRVTCFRHPSGKYLGPEVSQRRAGPAPAPVPMWSPSPVVHAKAILKVVKVVTEVGLEDH